MKKVMAPSPFITVYIKVDEKRAVQIEIHPVESENRGNCGKRSRKWLKDKHVQEIKQLLKDTIIQKMSTPVSINEESTKASTSPQIITGSLVRLGYTFKKKSEHHILLIPDSDEDSDNETAMKYFSICGQKLVVYVCLIDPGSPKSMSQLLKVLNDTSSGSQRKSVSISNYFTNRGVKCSQRSLQMSSSGQTGDSSAMSSGDHCENLHSTLTDNKDQMDNVCTLRQPVSDNDDKRTAIKSLLKRVSKAKKNKKKEIIKTSASKNTTDNIDWESEGMTEDEKLLSLSDKSSKGVAPDLVKPSEPICCNDKNRNSKFESLCNEELSSECMIDAGRDCGSPQCSSVNKMTSAHDNELSDYQTTDTIFRKNSNVDLCRLSGDDKTLGADSRSSGCSVPVSIDDNIDIRSPISSISDIHPSSADMSMRLSSSDFCVKSSDNKVPSLYDPDSDSRSSVCFHDDSYKTTNKDLNSKLPKDDQNSFYQIRQITLCKSSVNSDDMLNNLCTALGSSSDIQSFTVVGVDQIDDVGIPVKKLSDSGVCSVKSSHKASHSSDDGHFPMEESVLPCYSFIQKTRDGSIVPLSHSESDEHCVVNEFSIADNCDKLIDKSHTNFDITDTEVVRPDGNFQSGEKNFADDFLSPVFHKSKSLVYNKNHPTRIDSKSFDNRDVNAGSVYDYDNEIQVSSPSKLSQNNYKKRQRSKRTLPSMSPTTSDDESDQLPKLRRLDKKGKRRADVKMEISGHKENIVCSKQTTLPLVFKKRLSQLNLLDKNGHILIEDKDDNLPLDNEELDCVLMEQMSELSPVKREELEDMKKEIKSLQTVSEINEQQLQFLVLQSECYLRDIFQGKVSCRRHEEYKKGGKSRKNLNYDVHLGLYTEEQQDTVMETLMSIFCKRHHKYLDYLMKVLLPEMLIKIYMEVHGTSHEETEEVMYHALSTPGSIYH